MFSFSQKILVDNLKSIITVLKNCKGFEKGHYDFRCYYYV